MKGRLSITRRVGGGRGDKICIQVLDEVSRTRFLELEVDLATFSSVLTGVAEQECEMKVKGLENIGKTKVQESIIFTIPCCSYSEDREELAILCSKQFEVDGWKVHQYYNSKNSFYTKDDYTYARTTKYKYVGE